MDHYVDIRIRRDPEFTTSQLMNILFTKLHLILVALKSTDIGISFPEVNKGPALGCCLRLHGDGTRLQTAIEHSALLGIRDYIDIGRIAPVPAQVKEYCRVRRVMVKGNPERLLRRQMRRHPDKYNNIEDARQAAIRRLIDNNMGMTERTASEQVDHGGVCKLPFISLKSQSTGQSFRLFIHHINESRPQPGIFNSYGLSASATVPWF